jgi:hypothetical protein
MSMLFEVGHIAGYSPRRRTGIAGVYAARFVSLTPQASNGAASEILVEPAHKELYRSTGERATGARRILHLGLQGEG